jgi:hypothetical protein
MAPDKEDDDEEEEESDEEEDNDGSPFMTGNKQHHAKDEDVTK